MMRKVLVTGGAGFIGSAVCRHLVGAGVNVVNVDVLILCGQSEFAVDDRQAPNYRFARIETIDLAA